MKIKKFLETFKRYFDSHEIVGFISANSSTAVFVLGFHKLHDVRGSFVAAYILFQEGYTTLVDAQVITEKITWNVLKQLFLK